MREPPSSSQLSSVKLVKGILHVAPAGKFRNSLTGPVEAGVWNSEKKEDAGGQPVVMAVGVGHLSRLPHVVLEVLSIKTFEAVSRNDNRPARKWMKKDSPQQACIQFWGQGAARHRLTICLSHQLFDLSLLRLWKFCSDDGAVVKVKTNLAPSIAAATVPARVPGELNPHSPTVHRLAIKLLRTGSWPSNKFMKLTQRMT